MNMGVKWPKLPKVPKPKLPDVPNSIKDVVSSLVTPGGLAAETMGVKNISEGLGMKDPLSMFEGIFSLGQSGTSMQDVLEAGTKKRDSAFMQELLEARGSGSVSRQTIEEIMGSLKTSDFNTKALRDIFMAEKEGTSKEGRSRLATQKLFETVADQPGRKQTLLTPRSNTSRGILGV